MAQVKWGNVALTLVALVGLGGMGVAAKRYLDRPADPASADAGEAGGATDPGAPAPSGDSATAAAAPKGKGKSGPLGSKGNPIRINMVQFHGYAAFVAANGGLETADGSEFAKSGVYLDIDWRDDIPPFGTALSEGYTCSWRTTADWALDQPGIRDVTAPGQTPKQDARGILILDNTRGADACITKDPNIKSIEDLPGHTVAFLQGTPSHAMIVDAINNASLNPRQRKAIKFKEISPDKGTDEVAAIYAAGDADVACLWDFDLSLAKKQVPGSREIYSTAQASDLIYDMLICDAGAVADPANKETFTKLVGVAMAYADAAEKNPKPVLDMFVSVSDGYSTLVKSEGKDFVYGLMRGLDWTGAADNRRVLGLDGGQNQYEAVYGRFGDIWRELGLYARPDYLKVQPKDSFDYSFVEAATKAVKVEAAPAPVFTEQAKAVAVAEAPSLTKPVYITFATGSAELTARTRKTLDEELAPFIDANSSAYLLISGNTDSTGSAAANRKISQARAAAVRDYLVTQWEYDPKRFEVRGNGPDSPICNESDPVGDGYADLGACREANRNVGVSVLR